MVIGGGLALLEPVHDEDTYSWYKRLEVYLAANGWDKAKKLLHLPTLLRGHAFDSLGEGNMDIHCKGGTSCLPESRY